MRRSAAILSLLLIMPIYLSAQMTSGKDTFFGNEWIRFDQKYFKILVPEDGIYRLSSQVMINSGIPVSQLRGEQFQVFFNGREIPIYTSNEGQFAGNDFIEFFGEQNRSQLDRFLFKNPDTEMMNPLYSMVTDSSAYFLTWKQSGGNRRVATIPNNLTNLPPKEEFYQAELVLNYFNTHRKKQNTQGISSSDFGPTEGFSSAFANNQSFTINPSSLYTAGRPGKLSIRYSGNNGLHKQLITLNGQELTTDEFFDYEVRQLSFDVPNATMANLMQLRFQGKQASNDHQRISNIILRYPRQFNFENRNRYFFDIAPSNSVRYVEISNFSHAGSTPVLYDINNGQRFSGVVENNIVKFAFPPSTFSRKLILVNGNTGVNVVSRINEVQFINYNELNGEFIIISNPALYKDGSGKNWVKEYADYRSSADGGSYKSIIVDIQQLYDQFAWGQNRHPLSIRNFVHFANKFWPNPQYVFIIGKGREYPGIRTSGQLASPANATFFVPTFGVPGSDNLLVAGEDGFTPVIPIGRIAVSSTYDIRIYLNKVKEFEGNKNLPQTIEDRAWMKRVLHMGGGLTAAEQSVIRNSLAQMQSIIETNSYGLEVKSFYKTSSDPIQVSQTEQIFRVINTGVSFISFFGHSSVSGFDFSIDNPDNYSNKGKYPMIVSLGCYSGNQHTSGIGVGERFLFFENKGAIAFGATAGQGYISSLSVFAKEYYNQLGGALYGAGVADAIKKSVGIFQTGDFGLNLIRQQFNLQGDPALRLNMHNGPDYTIDPSSLVFSPHQLNTQLKHFELTFDVVNLGKNIQDSVKLIITQELPDGSKVKVMDTRIATPSFRTRNSFKIPMLGSTSVGINRFYIDVDTDNSVDEQPFPEAENNNQLMIQGSAGISKFISDNSVVCIYPTEFGIVSSPDVVLKASTTNLLLAERSYIFQIDTTENFNSPLLQSTKIIQKGGVIRWKPTVLWQNNTVYYWRVSSDSLSPSEPLNWNVSSFIYLPGSSNGWNQSHFYQMKKNEFVNMELLSHSNLKFLDNFKDCFIRNAVNSVELIELQINNAYSGRFWYNFDAGIYAVVFDSTTVKQWTNTGPAGPNNYGVPHPNGWWVATFLFNTTTQPGRAQLIDFLENVVPENNYVLLFTVQGNLNADYKPQDWESDQPVSGTDLFQVMEKQGAALIRSTINTGSRPYVFAYKKGARPITEVLADSLKQVLRVNFSMPGYWDRGEIMSTSIGPAKSWTSLKWEGFSTSVPETDTISVDVFATNPVTLIDSLLFSEIPSGEFDLTNVDATAFPFLRLRFNSEDSILRTSAQLKYWRVLYEGVPDFAVNPAGYFSFLSDSLQQGKSFQLGYLIENLSKTSNDSLLIRYALKNAANEETEIFQKIRPLSKNDTLVVHTAFDTRLLNGVHNLQVELNPGNKQPELTRVNNVLNNSFYVETDRRNPLLDVTFDGVNILDGDLVSAKPVIRISLKDENQYLALSDTAIFRLFLVYPDSSEALRRIYFNDPMLQFFPANASNVASQNSAAVELRPVLLQDGEYQLLVQAQDATGNASGSFDYKIRFKVITKSMISNVLNYPNPFTTSTRFVYTLTGSEPPQRYKIQIMTVSGRIVKELTQDELGTLKVGTHQTDYAWDGTDEFGDPLAKGIYLYRVLVQDGNGKEWEKYESGADAFIKNGYGKMVLLR